MNLYDLRHLVKGSVWVDAERRTLVVWEVHAQNAVTIGAYSLLIIPSMQVVRRKASEVEALVKAGKMQYCREVEWII